MSRIAKSAHTSGHPQPEAELSFLRDFLLCYYHQDAWVNHKTHEKIWTDFFSHAPKESQGQVQAELTKLLAKDTTAIRKFVEAHADGLVFRTSKEYRTWAGKFSSWLAAQMSSNTSLERTREG